MRIVGEERMDSRLGAYLFLWTTANARALSQVVPDLGKEARMVSLSRAWKCVWKFRIAWSVLG